MKLEVAIENESAGLGPPSFGSCRLIPTPNPNPTSPLGNFRISISTVIYTVLTRTTVSPVHHDAAARSLHSPLILYLPHVRPPLFQISVRSHSPARPVLAHHLELIQGRGVTTRASCPCLSKLTVSLRSPVHLTTVSLDPRCMVTCPPTRPHLVSYRPIRYGGHRIYPR